MRFIAFALAAAIVATAQAAQISIPAGAKIQAGGGTISAGCADLVIAGQLTSAGTTMSGIANLTISSGGVFSLASATASLGGNWSNAGTFTNNGSSTVAFVDQCATGNATLTGATNFFNLTFTSSTARTFTIPAGLVTTVAGTLLLSGPVGTPIQVVSANPTQPTRIVTGPGAIVTGSGYQLGTNVTVGAGSFALTVATTGAGSGTVTSNPAGISCGATCSANFASGVSVGLTATPSAGSYLAGWTGDCTGTGACNVTMTAARSVTAEFRPTTAIPRLANISTRMQVLTGNDVMIGGFVIGGSATKRVAIVATGPSLVPFGINNALANPTLSLVRSSDQQVLATNDDWQSAANQAALSAAGFAPSNALEAAILADLPPGAYTAIVSGVSSGTGVAVVGVYEVDHPEIPLINISTRGKVLTGNDVMIGGFVIQGSGSQTLAIVATGPSLGQFGIANPLANPKITLVRSSDQQVLATNDDWQSDPNASQLTSAGFAPSNPLEAALYVTLPPGAYTVIVEGVGGGTGVAVIGVYKVN